MKYSLLLTLLLPVVIGSNLNLIEDYFKDSEEIKNVAIFACSNVHTLHKLAIFLSNSNIYFEFILNLNIEDLTKLFAQKCIFVVDFSCSESNLFLLESSKLSYFNSSYHWIILNEQNINFGVIFENVTKIGINSNIMLISKIHENVYNIFEVFGRGSQLEASVIVKNIGLWTIETGFKTETPIYLYNRKNRGDLGGLELRGGIVRLFNMSPDSVYHAEVNKLLMHIFNFK